MNIRSLFLGKKNKGAALVEYVVLFAALAVPMGTVVVDFAREDVEPLYEVPGVLLFDGGVVEVDPGDPTGGPDGVPDNIPANPPPTGTWSNDGGFFGGPGMGVGGSGGGSVVIRCAPNGTRWNGSAWEAPGVSFNVNPSPKHSAYPRWSPAGSPPKGTILSYNVPYYQFWYPNYMGEHVFFFLTYEYWGEEVVIPPNEISRPGPSCS